MKSNTNRLLGNLRPTLEQAKGFYWPPQRQCFWRQKQCPSLHLEHWQLVLQQSLPPFGVGGHNYIQVRSEHLYSDLHFLLFEQLKWSDSSEVRGKVTVGVGTHYGRGHCNRIYKKLRNGCFIVAIRDTDYLCILLFTIPKIQNTVF